MQHSITPDQIPSNLTLLWKGFTKRCDNAELPEARIQVDQFRFDLLKLRRYNQFCGFEQDVLSLSYLFVATQPLQLMLLTDPSVPVKPLGMIHLGVSFYAHKPLDLEQSYRFELSVGEQGQTEKGLEFELVGRFFEGEEEVAGYRSQCLLKMPSTERRRRRRGAREPKVAYEWSKVTDIGLDEVHARGYARVSGDYNPIHLHRLTSKPFGFDAPIAHGMYMVARVLAEVALPLKEAKFEFKRPALLPIAGSLEQDGEAVRLVNEGGKPLVEGSVRYAE
ncbi:MaoC/PaaZ C-terminal domain-containing protein [Ferrimonas marina]|uniref:MaoC like domain-containing protein n=1 Tax=Ferrimonas marina TaxID=299255 RepID=A0A1M5P2C8_9GAMM|nr:MaoC/PaaZ C-terminal domain-containing protein [Ferrimonas marina]SHG95942.1 MaoC like domain-containing protein [Ferrimonas marina]